MKHAKKLMVVPFTKEYNNKIDQLDHEMSQLVNKKNLPVDMKLKLYNQTMRKFISMYDPAEYDHDLQLIKLNQKVLDDNQNMATKIIEPLRDHQVEIAKNIVDQIASVNGSQKSSNTYEENPDLMELLKNIENKVNSLYQTKSEPINETYSDPLFDDLAKNFTPMTKSTVKQFRPRINDGINPQNILPEHVHRSVKNLKGNGLLSIPSFF